MSRSIHETAALGELVAAAFDTAAEFSTDTNEISRLATSTVIHMLRGARRRLPLTVQEAAARAPRAPIPIAPETYSELGQLNPGVAHDLKNLLNPIGLYLQLVERAMARGEVTEVAEHLAVARKLVSRGVEAIDHLRDNGSNSARPPGERLELNALVREVCRIARPLSKVDQVHEELGAPLAIMGSPADLVSALFNLTVNALDALAGEGTVTLRTGQSNEWAWVEVKDDGPGMSPEVASRAFEPYFTTKGTHGTGLGLSMVFACMQHHHGSVKVDSAVGHGACFTLSFPAVSVAFDDP